MVALIQAMLHTVTCSCKSAGGDLSSLVGQARAYLGVRGKPPLALRCMAAASDWA